ncbi:hypothetical protein ADUPG1_000090, partial [Aduncisulcus paluster]
MSWFQPKEEAEKRFDRRFGPTTIILCQWEKIPRQNEALPRPKEKESEEYGEEDGLYESEEEEEEEDGIFSERPIVPQSKTIPVQMSELTIIPKTQTIISKPTSPKVVPKPISMHIPPKEVDLFDFNFSMARKVPIQNEALPRPKEKESEEDGEEEEEDEIFSERPIVHQSKTIPVQMSELTIIPKTQTIISKPTSPKVVPKPISMHIPPKEVDLFDFNFSMAR